MTNNQIEKNQNKRTLADINQFSFKEDPKGREEQVLQELNSLKNGDLLSEEKTPNLFNYYITFEFEKGMLLAEGFEGKYRPFVIDLNRKIQKEFDCRTVSEKSLAESVAMNFCRTLYLQNKIDCYLQRRSFTDIGVGYLNYLSKDLDRANRHYLTSLQALKSIKQPNLEVNINAQTAVVGQNQVIQTNNQ